MISATAFPPWLSQQLACPISKGKLLYDIQTNALISCDARVAYPVEQGVLKLVAHEATLLSADAHAAALLRNDVAAPNAAIRLPTN